MPYETDLTDFKNTVIDAIREGFDTISVNRGPARINTAYSPRLDTEKAELNFLQQKLNLDIKNQKAYQENIEKVQKITKEMKELEKHIEAEKQLLMLANNLSEREYNLNEKIYVNKEKLAKLEEYDIERKRLLQQQSAIMQNRDPSDVDKKSLFDMLKEKYSGSQMMKGGVAALAFTGASLLIDKLTDGLRAVFGDIVKRISEYNIELRKSAIDANVVYNSTDYLARKSSIDSSLKGFKNEAETSGRLTVLGIDQEEAYRNVVDFSRKFKDFAKNMEDPTSAIKAVEKLGTEAALAGMRLSEYSKEIIEFSKMRGMDEKSARTSIKIITDYEKELNLERNTLLNNIKSTHQSLATMGFTIGEITGLNVRFAKSIEQGRMSLGDIVNFAKGMKEATSGQQLYFAEMLKSFGSDTDKRKIEALEKKSGGDPMVMATLLRGLAEGDPQTAAILGMSAEQSRQWHRTAALKVGKQSMVSQGITSQEQQLAYMEPFFKSLGISFTGGELYKQREFLKDYSIKDITTTGKPIEESLQESTDKFGKHVDGYEKISEQFSHAVDKFSQSVSDIFYSRKLTDYSTVTRALMEGKPGKAERLYSELPKEWQEKEASYLAEKLKTDNELKEKYKGYTFANINVNATDTNQIVAQIRSILDSGRLLQKESGITNIDNSGKK